MLEFQLNEAKNKSMAINLSTPLISIIVINWNGEKHIQKCFEAIFRQTFKNFQVILVDNGSTDNSSEKILEQWQNIEFIKLEKKYRVRRRK